MINVFNIQLFGVNNSIKNEKKYLIEFVDSNFETIIMNKYSSNPISLTLWEFILATLHYVSVCFRLLNLLKLNTV